MCYDVVLQAAMDWDDGHINEFSPVKAAKR
jgi:hypothetical protein